MPLVVLLLLALVWGIGCGDASRPGKFAPRQDALARDEASRADDASTDGPLATTRGSDDGPSGTAPLARAGEDQRGVVGIPVRLDGRGSSGQALTFRWTLAAAPAGSAAQLSGPQTPQPRLDPDRAGTFRLRLVVSDGRGHSEPDEVSVTVADRGRWLAHRVGSGEIPNLLGGPPIELPLERRVHVVILPEGFTQPDLDAGALDTEIDRWWAEVSAIEPYASHREALVVWKLPLPSASRVSTSSPTDTALRLPLTPDGLGVASVPTNGATATRLWEALRDFPVPLAFYGAGGRTSHLARNLVAVVTILHPTTRRAGFSGRTVNLTDPDDGNRRVAVAIAFGRAHELTHAFARLSDEYLEDRSPNYGVEAPAARTSAGVLNLARGNACEGLPWRHLLAGSAINPVIAELVGAFGTDRHGYHPELKCLMNGTHDNAAYYGGRGLLRTSDRLCNFCRELTAFRLLERTGTLPDPRTSYATWAQRYRQAFYQRFGFQVPPVVPQRNDAGWTWYQACRQEPRGLEAATGP